MADETVVGGIALELTVADKTQAGINEAAKNAQKRAAAAFSPLGNTVAQSTANAVDASMKSAEASIDNAVKRITARVKQVRLTAAEAMKETGAKYAEPLSPEYAARNKKWEESARGKPLQAEASAQEKINESVKEAVRHANAYTDSVRAAASANDLLQKKLEVIEYQIIRQEAAYRKLLKAQAADGGDTSVIGNQIAAAESKLISLKASAIKTEDAIKRAVSPPPPADPANANKTSAALKKSEAATGATMKKVQSAAKGAAKAAGKALGGIGSLAAHGFKAASAKVKSSLDGMKNRVTRFTKSIGNAFKRVMIFATLYAAFRGFKSMLQDGVMSNEKFAKSFDQIKANLTVAFTPIFTAILPALNMLASVAASVSQKIAAATAGMFGQTYQQAVNATKKMQDTKKAADKAKGSLAGFDNITTINTGSGEESNSGANLDALDGAKYTALEGMGEKITEMLEGLAAKVGPLIASVAAKIAEKAPAFINAAVRVINALLKGINDNFPQITAAIISLIESLLAGLAEISPQLAEFAVNAITLMIAALLTYAPKLFEIGITLLADVLAGLADKMPELVPMAQKAIMTIVNAIVNNLPKILKSGVEILLALIKGILEVLPDLIPAVISIIKTLLTTLIENLPKIIKGGVEILVALLQGIAQALPTIIPAVVELLYVLTGALWDNLPLVIEAGLDIVIALIVGLIQALPIIAKRTPEIIEKIIASLLSCRAKIFEAGWKLIIALVDAFRAMDWGQMGRDLIDGIIRGVKNSAASVGNAIKGLFGFDVKVGGSVPAMASGGIVSAPTLSLIGERGKEAVLPLERNTGWMDTFASKVASQLGGGGGNTTINETIVLDDGTLIHAYRRKIGAGDMTGGARGMFV